MRQKIRMLAVGLREERREATMVKSNPVINNFFLPYLSPIAPKMRTPEARAIRNPSAMRWI